MGEGQSANPSRVEPGQTTTGHLWTDRRLTIRIVGPDGERTVDINKPYARIGSHTRSEVILDDSDVPKHGLYLHATDRGIFCLPLWDSSDELAANRGWVTPNQGIPFGNCQVHASFTDGPEPVADPEWMLDEKGSARLPVPVIYLLVNEERRATYRVYRSLTVVGRDKPSALRLRSEFISLTHCVLYWQDGKLWFVDLLSSNGTEKRGRRCEAERFRLGRTIKIGDVLLGFARTTVEPWDASSQREEPAPAEPKHIFELNAPQPKDAHLWPTGDGSSLHNIDGLEDSWEEHGDSDAHLDKDAAEAIKEMRRQLEAERTAWETERLEKEQMLAEQHHELDRSFAEIQSWRDELSFRSHQIEQDLVTKQSAQMAADQTALDEDRQALAHEREELEEQIEHWKVWQKTTQDEQATVTESHRQAAERNERLRAELTTLAADLDRERQQLAADLAGQRQQVEADLERQRQQLDADLENKNQHVAANLAALQSHQHELESQRQILAKQDQALAAQQQEIATQQQEVTAQQQEITAQLSQLDEARHALSGERTLLEAQQRTVAAEREQLEESRRTLDTDRQELESQREAFAADRAMLDDRCATLATDRQQLESQREAFTAERALLDDRCATLATDRQQLESQREAFDADRAMLDDRCATLDTDRQQLESQREAFDADRAMLDDRCATLDTAQQKLETLRRELHAEQQTLVALRQELDIARQSLDSERAEISLLQQSVVGASSVRGAELEKQHKALTELRQQITKEQQALETQRKQWEAEQHQAAAAEQKRLATAQQKAESAAAAEQQRLAAAQQKAESAAAEQQRLAAEQAARIADAERLLASREEQTAAAETRIQNELAQLDATHRELEQAQLELREKQRELQHQSESSQQAQADADQQLAKRHQDIATATADLQAERRQMDEQLEQLRSEREALDDQRRDVAAERQRLEQFAIEQTELLALIEQENDRQEADHRPRLAEFADASPEFADIAADYTEDIENSVDVDADVDADADAAPESVDYEPVMGQQFEQVDPVLLGEPRAGTPADSEKAAAGGPPRPVERIPVDPAADAAYDQLVDRLVQFQKSQKRKWLKFW